MMPFGEVTTKLSTDKTLVTITSLEGDHDCCYQVAGYNKAELQDLIERLIDLHSQMVD